jgi:hypothetical protein
MGSGITNPRKKDISREVGPVGNFPGLLNRAPFDGKKTVKSFGNACKQIIESTKL